MTPVTIPSLKQPLGMRSTLVSLLGLLALAPGLLGAAGAPAPRHLVNPYSTTPTMPSDALATEGPHAPIALHQTLLPAAPARWTVMIYGVGDNNLEEYISSDIETELGLVGSTANVQVVILADRSPDYDTSDGNWTDTRFFHITQGQKATADAAVSVWGERNMGDPATLAEFVSYSKSYFPADHYALVFWDHGWVWRPGQSMQDETDADTLDMDEMGDALEVAGPVDVVGFDACLMATLEVQSAFRPYAKALVASEDYVGYEGFKYEDFLASLNAMPSMDANEAAVALASTMNDRTVSAVALDARWDALQSAVDNWARVMSSGLAKNRSSYESAWKASKGFADPLTKDLRDTALKFKANTKDSALKDACQRVIDTLDATMLYEWHLDVYSRAYGTTIFFPWGQKDLDAPSSPANDFEFYQAKLPLAQDTLWDEFLLQYVAR